MSSLRSMGVSTTRRPSLKSAARVAKAPSGTLSDAQAISLTFSGDSTVPNPRAVLDTTMVLMGAVGAVFACARIHDRAMKAARPPIAKATMRMMMLARRMEHALNSQTGVGIVTIAAL